jgi:hypothetical protein
MRDTIELFAAENSDAYQIDAAPEMLPPGEWRDADEVASSYLWILIVYMIQHVSRPPKVFFFHSRSEVDAFVRARRFTSFHIEKKGIPAKGSGAVADTPRERSVCAIRDWLPSTTWTMLLDYEVETLGELVDLGTDGLLRKGFSEVALKHIRRGLTRHGLRLVRQDRQTPAAPRPSAPAVPSPGLSIAG